MIKQIIQWRDQSKINQSINQSTKLYPLSLLVELRTLRRATRQVPTSHAWKWIFSIQDDVLCDWGASESKKESKMIEARDWKNRTSLNSKLYGWTGPTWAALPGEDSRRSAHFSALPRLLRRPFRSWTLRPRNTIALLDTARSMKNTVNKHMVSQPGFPLVEMFPKKSQKSTWNIPLLNQEKIKKNNYLFHRHREQNTTEKESQCFLYCWKIKNISPTESSDKLTTLSRSWWRGSVFGWNRDEIFGGNPRKKPTPSRKPECGMNFFLPDSPPCRSDQ